MANNPKDAGAGSSSSMISDEEAVRCALSIPEEFVPTPHKEFIKGFEGQEERRMSLSMSVAAASAGIGKERKRRFLSPTGVRPRLQQSPEAEYRGITNTGPGTSKTLLVRERERKLRSTFAKYKKWDEGEKCKVEKLENNRIRVNDAMVLEIDYTNYIKEGDVVLKLDEDYRKCKMPELPEAEENPEPECGEDACRFGCVCGSIKMDAVVREHCGKAKCFFDCACQQSLLGNGDDGDIRSRLRPRVSLLNWRFMEPEQERDPRPVNYRQLERGVTNYPRMRRMPVAPQRYRNDGLLSRDRERRKSVVSIANKLIRKPGTTTGVKRNAAGSIYRRNLLVKHHSLSGVTKKDSSGRITTKRIASAKPGTSKSNSKKSEEDEVIIMKVPNVVNGIQKDALMMLIGLGRVCFLTFSLRCKIPKVIIYEKGEGDLEEVPWLYLPFTPAGETWIFHPIRNIEGTQFTLIPEIRCIVPSKVLRMNQNLAQEYKKCCALKMLWIGNDSKKREGSIYLFPELPNAIICGPFQRSLIRTRLHPEFDRSQLISDACDFLDTLTGTSGNRTFGDAPAWGTFFKGTKEKIYAEARAKVAAEEAAIQNNPTIENVIEDEDDTPSSSNSRVSSPSSSQTDEMEYSESDSLRVTWGDAANMLSVPSESELE